LLPWLSMVGEWVLHGMLMTKISHMDREVVGEVIDWFEYIYENARISHGYIIMITWVWI